MDKPLSQERLSEVAERLGCYKLLTDLETEWVAYRKNILLYPSCVADAIIGHIFTLRKQISTFEMNEAELVAIEGQLQLNAELNKAVERELKHAG